MLFLENLTKCKWYWLYNDQDYKNHNKIKTVKEGSYDRTIQITIMIENW